MPDHTIAENLTRLQTVRTNIASAITTKGGTVASGAGFEDFPTAIGTIPSGGGGGSQDLIDLIERDITSISIPSGVTKLGPYAFGYCGFLKSIEIPSSVTNIGSYAFQSCIALTSIKFLGLTPPAASGYTAWNSLPTTCTIYVPTGSLTAYTTADYYPSPNTYTYVEY
mgnify:CR=1 FL=1